MARRRVIDINCNWFPSREIIADYLLTNSLSRRLAPYLARVYGPRIEALHGIKMGELLAARERVPLAEYRAMCEREAEKAALPVASVVKMLDEAGVEKAVFYAIDEETTLGFKGLSNDYYADLVAKCPDRFIAFAGADPGKGMAAVRELERAVKELGLRGLVLRPFMNEMYPNDRRYYPLYAKCIELDIPVWFHASINFGQGTTMDYGRPIYLDYVACDLPELKIIVGHAGWPWITELVGLAWKHPNVYIEFSLMRPKYVGMHNTGWEPLVQYGNSVIQDKLLFSSAWFILGLPIRQVIDETEALIAKEEVKDKWFYRNAARVLGLE